MLDQNTDRLWYVIGAVLIGAAIILLLNGSAPQIFAQVAGTYEDLTEGVTDEIDKGTITEEDLVELGQINDFSDLRGGWSGSSVTITPNQTVDEWGTDQVSRIQTSGGSSDLKAHLTIIDNQNQVPDREYVYRVNVKNLGDEPIRIYNNKGSEATVQPGESTQVTENAIGSIGASNWQFQLHADDASKDVDVLLHNLRWGYEANEDDGE